MASPDASHQGKKERKKGINCQAVFIVDWNYIFDFGKKKKDNWKGAGWPGTDPIPVFRRLDS